MAISAARKARAVLAACSVVVIGLAPVEGFRDRFQLARGQCTARVLRSPLRTWAARSATAERPRRGRQTTLSTRTNLKTWSFRASLQLLLLWRFWRLTAGAS